MKLIYKINGHKQEIEFTSLNKAIAKARALGYDSFYDGTSTLSLEFYKMRHQNDTKYVGGSATKYCVVETELGHKIGVCQNPKAVKYLSIGYSGLYKQARTWKTRARGDKYTPYLGHSEWEKAANAAMKSAAQYNFQNK